MLSARPFGELLRYGLNCNWYEEVDMIYYANRLASFYPVSAKQILEQIPTTSKELEEIMKNILDEMSLVHLFSPDTLNQRDLMESELLNHLLPKPSEVIETFKSLQNKNSANATTYFYELSKSTNYIKTKRIAQNISYTVSSSYGTIEITINVSKPEKDPLDIAGGSDDVTYPKCVLCKEQVGYIGGAGAAPRAIHRIVPVLLANELFWIQFSPYSYYEEHLICLKDTHEPMHVTVHTFDRLLDFVDQFEHYFIGSNASKPFVGGSILNHEHYQGGKHRFPMEDAKALHTYNIDEVTVSQLHWPLNVVKLVSENRFKVLKLAKALFLAWEQEEGYGLKSEHNALTPIVRKEGREYHLYLALRNNETTPVRPLGKFHVHPKRHNIKKENIGLIEVMGLAVLPKRLINEVDQIIHAKGNPDLMPKKHLEWVQTITYQSKIDLYNEIGHTFTQALEDCKVLSDDELEKWLEEQL